MSGDRSDGRCGKVEEVEMKECGRTLDEAGDGDGRSRMVRRR